MDNSAEKIEAMQSVLISSVTGGFSDEPAYQHLRRYILSKPLLKELAPAFLKDFRSLEEFWPYIKGMYGHYAERRKFVWDSFRPMLERIEETGSVPSDQNVSGVLQTFDPESIHQIWLRAMDRRDADPEGAITLARSLLESVCKHILEDNSIVYEPDSDLPSLYKLTAKSLNIAPSQHSEPIFRQILGGCTAVVEGLGALRNRLSDAHGQGKRPVKPAPRHAELAVNLSGTVAVFLVSTHQARVTAG